MKFNPIQPVKESGVASNRLVPGCVVEYEQHGKSILGVTLEERKQRWGVLNERGQEVELAPDRLFIISKALGGSPSSKEQQKKELEQFRLLAEKRRAEIQMEEIWGLLKENMREYSALELAEIAFGEVGPEGLLAMRHALIEDTVYFKRKKVGFEPRPSEVVEELKIQFAVTQKRETERRELIDALSRRLNGDQVKLPPGVSKIEVVAAQGNVGHEAKEVSQLIDELAERHGLKLPSRLEDRAFSILLRTKHFTEDQDLTLIGSRRPKNFSTESMAEVQSLLDRQGEILQTSNVVSFCSEFLVTIDAEDTRDIDDALSIDRTPDGGFLIGVHISDVARFIQADSALERDALRRATSVYAPDYKLEMFPRELSESLLSLCAGEKRGAVSYLAELDSTFAVKSRRIQRSIITVGKRLSYNEVDEILYSAAENDPLLLLWNAANAFEGMRLEKGAIQFNRRELSALVGANGKISLEDSGEDKPSRKLVSEMMIFANECAAIYAKESRLPLVCRKQGAPEVDIAQASQGVVEGPAREYYMRGLMKRSEIAFFPEPHFGLGLSGYLQMTSPIRRYLDLINQRQLCNHLESGALRYSVEELTALVESVEPVLDEANLIQRTRGRYWLLKYLLQEGFKELEGVIVRADEKRALAEIEPIYVLHPVQLKRDLNVNPASRVGERVRFKIESVDLRREIFKLREC